MFLSSIQPGINQTRCILQELGQMIKKIMKNESSEIKEEFQRKKNIYMENIFSDLKLNFNKEVDSFFQNLKD
jgi:hypothetical protein